MRVPPKLIAMLLRRRVIIAATLLILFGAVITLLPVLIRHSATTWLQEHGIAAASIHDVDLNPFTATFAVEDLDAGDGLKIGRLTVDLDWWPLTRHQLSIHKLVLRDAQLQLQQDTAGNWLPAGLTLPPASPGQTATAADATEQPWQPILHTVELRHVQLAADSKTLHMKQIVEHLQLRLRGQQPDGSQQLAADVETGAGEFRGNGFKAGYATMYAVADIVLPPLGGDLPDRLSVKVPQAHVGQLRLAVGKAGRKAAGQGAAAVSIGGIQLKDFAAGAGSAELALLKLTNIGADTDAGASLGSIGSIRLKQARLERPDKLSLASLDIEGIDLRLLRQKDGRFAALNALAAQPPATSAPPEAPAPTATAETGKPAPQLSIGQLRIVAGSRLTFRDESVTPTFEKKLTVKQFSIAPLTVPGDKEAAVDVRLQIDGQGELTLSGSALPSATSPAADLDLQLKRLDMASLSGYTERRFGQAIQTGQLDLQGKVKVAGNDLDAQNTLTLRQLVLKPASRPGEATGLGMPADMALDMLRDSRGDIRLKVPVTGKLDDPNIDFSDAINQALMYAMQAGAVQYASQFLQPYGSLITAAKLAGKVAAEAAKPRLTPITFPGQSAKLSPDMQAYAGKISELLKAQDFRLQVCGFTTRSEAEPNPKAGRFMQLNDEAMLRLAADRSEAVIEALTKHGIDADRLFHCRDRIDDDKKAVPRTALILD